jgi:hypothetical protein
MSMTFPSVITEGMCSLKCVHIVKFNSVVQTIFFHQLLCYKYRKYFGSELKEKNASFSHQKE